MHTSRRTLKLPISFEWMLILALAAVVYAIGLSHESIWYDEAYSAAMAGHSLGQIVWLTTFDNHPPLYYLLLGLVRMVLGNSEWALRALSALGAVGLVGLGAGPLRRLAGNRTALMYAGVVLFTPAILTYAHEARMYTLSILAVTAGVLYGCLAVQENRTRDWACLVLATLAAAYQHYYGLIAAFFTYAVLFFWLWAKHRERVKACLIAGAVFLAGYLPWLAIFIKQSLMVHRGFWLGSPSVQAVEQAFLQPFAYRELYPTVSTPMLLALLVAVLLIVFGLAMAVRKRTWLAAPLSLCLLVVYLGTLLTTLLISLGLMPIFYSRYMLVCLGLFLVLVSLGLNALPTKVLPWLALGIFALLNLPTLHDLYTRRFNYPMKTLAEKLSGAIQPGDLVITTDSYSLGGALYYFPGAVHYYHSNSIEIQWDDVLKVFIPPLHYAEGLDERLSARQAFWYVSCNVGYAYDIHEVLHGEGGWEKSGEAVTAVEPYSFVEFTAQKYAYAGPAKAGAQGALTVRISGLKPTGYLQFILYDAAALRSHPGFSLAGVFRDMGNYALYKPDLLGSDPRPYVFEVIHIAGPEAAYTFYDLPYGEYALVVGHDEVRGHVVPVDPATRLPAEGVYIVNLGKAGLLKGAAAISLDSLKFSFEEPEQTIRGNMMYPPFR